MKIEVDINKKYFMIVLGIIFLLAGTLVYAYGTSSPSVVGHSSGEIQLPSDLCRSNRTGCPAYSLTCIMSNCTKGGTVVCPSGYVQTSLSDSCTISGFPPIMGNKGMCCKVV
jgi:uncharacterized membrane protein